MNGSADSTFIAVGGAPGANPIGQNIVSARGSRGGAGLYFNSSTGLLAAMVQPQYLTVVLVLDRVVQGLQGKPEAVLVAVVAELPSHLQRQLMVMPVLRNYYYL